MKILLAHNYYQQAGGEDEVFASERRLLEQHGHEVRAYKMHNDQVESLGKLALAKKTIWNREVYDQLRATCKEFKPDIAHFHNTFPLMSPAAYSAAKDEGAGVVQTLHNYRLLCPGATFFRDNKVCELCLHKTVKIPAVIHKCYRDNRGASAVTAAMLAVHRVKGTYYSVVARYIALSDFARGKYIAAGFPENKISVKPNFVDPDPVEGTGDGGYALFVGRLTEEKGIQTLLDAWAMSDGSIPLKIVGDGPLKSHVEAEAARIKNVEYLGRKNQQEVADLMGRAMTLIFPSLWYEGMPRTIIESFAKGTPVIASDLGTMKSMVGTPFPNRVYPSGDARELIRIVNEVSRSTSRQAERQQARDQYLQNYSGEKNIGQLVAIYHDAIGK